MITSRFPLGDVSFSAEYFSTLVGEATKQCYGVAAMTPRDLTDVVKSVVRGNDYSEKGVRVTQDRKSTRLNSSHPSSSRMPSSA